MRTFVEYIKNYFKEEFNWKSHGFIGIFLGTCLYLNFGIDYGEYGTLYNAILLPVYKTPISIVYLFLFYSTPFLMSILILRLIDSKKSVLQSKYIVFALIGILFLSLDSSYYVMQFTDSWFAENRFVHAWAHSCFSNLSSFVTVIAPLFILYLLTKTFKPEWYGFRLNGAKVMPYFWLILFMIPLIYVASFRPDFLDHYPTYVDHYEYEHLRLSKNQTIGLYELTYGFDFISVELFFRGFLVVGLSKIVGRDVILPMVAVYCFLHFGKPAGEAISSIFGGYILGILAFKSRNIFGGLIAHLGVAWGMELLAFIQG